MWEAKWNQCNREPDNSVPFITESLYVLTRKHQDHLLQSLLHLRIHAALQKIENYSVQNELFGVVGEFAWPNQALVIKEDMEESGNESEFFDAEEDWDDRRPRQDSNSSFDIISDNELDTIMRKK